MNTKIDVSAHEDDFTNYWVDWALKQFDEIKTRLLEARKNRDITELNEILNHYVWGVFVGRDPRGLPTVNADDSLKYFQDLVKDWVKRSETLQTDTEKWDAIRELYSKVYW